jgi:hypothetical protein
MLVMLPILVTQMFAPSKATAFGVVPAGKEIVEVLTSYRLKVAIL